MTRDGVQYWREPGEDGCLGCVIIVCILLALTVLSAVRDRLL